MSDRLAHLLAQAGVDTAFGLMGEDVARLIVALDAVGTRYLGTRHEAVAVAMADGYARASRRLGVAIVSRGPGLTNALTSVVCAAKGGSPVLVIAGDKPIGSRDAKRRSTAGTDRKYIDQRGVLDAAAVAHFDLDDAASAAADLARACDVALQGRTVVVNVPSDVFDLEPGDAPSRIAAPSGARDTPAPDPTEVGIVADLLQSGWAAQRPVILAGRGAVEAGARRDLERLAERCGALLSTTLLAKSFFAGEPFDIGVVGGLGTSLCGELMAGADVVLAFGASLHTFTTFRGQLFPRARVIQIDRDPAAFGRFLPVELGIRADAKAASAALADHLSARGHRAIGYRSDDVAQRIAEHGPADRFVDRGRPGALDPRAVMSALDSVLPRDRMLVVDAAHHMSFSCAYLSVPDPTSLVVPLEGSAVGYAMGVALGAAVARGDRPTILEIGDGGLMMSLADLDTAIRYRLPLIVIVANDGAFGAEVHYLQVKGLPDGTARFDNPSFEAIARALGMDATTVSTAEDLASLEQRLGPMRGPVLVDCRITPDVRASWVDFYFGAS